MDDHSFCNSRENIGCSGNPAFVDETKLKDDDTLKTKISDVTGIPHDPPVENTKTSQSEDSAWSWVVCFASFTHFLIYEGVFFSFGLVFIALIEEFDSSKRDTAWIISINIALSLLAGPFASTLSRRFGYWIVAILGTLITVTGMLASMTANCIEMLYLTYGFVSGLGHGLLYHASTVCVILSFDKKKALAAGIANVGVGIGMFIISPLVETCLKSYGWRGTILIESGLLLHGVACGLIYRSVKKPVIGISELHVKPDARQKRVFIVEFSREKPLYQDSEKVHIDTSVTNDKSCRKVEYCGRMKLMIGRITGTDSTLDLMKSLPFALFTLSMTLMFLSIYIPFFFIPDFAKSEGIDERISAWILAASGIAGTTSRIAFGWLSDRPWMNIFVAQATTFVLCGIFTGLMPFCGSYELLLAVAVMFSTFQGCIPALVSVLIAELVGREKVSQGFGIICWFSGFSNLLGPPIAGWLFDRFGNYYMSFWSFGIILVLSGCNLFVVAYLHRRNKTD